MLGYLLYSTYYLTVTTLKQDRILCTLTVATNFQKVKLLSVVNNYATITSSPEWFQLKTNSENYHALAPSYSSLHSGGLTVPQVTFHL